MNIVEKHLKGKARLDQVQTPRFHESQVDNAINTAIDFLIRGKVGGVIENGKRVSFQKVRTVRDELYTIVKSDDTDGTISVTDNVKIAKADFPEKYRYLLGVEIEVNSKMKDWTAPITYDDLFILKKDPYQRPSQDYPYNFYHIESNDGLEFYYDKNATDNITYARMFYISQPVSVYFGEKITAVTPETSVIAYTQCEYSGTTYNPGDEFTMTAGTSLTSGTAVKGFVNSDLPVSLHEDIVEDAAMILNMDIENYNKWKAMKEDEQLRKQ